MPTSPSPAFERVIAWDNLLAAYHHAARGKRRLVSAARFEHQLADHLLELQEELRSQESNHERRDGVIRFG